MQHDWQTFLTRHGAEINEHGILNSSRTAQQEIAMINDQCLLASLDFGIIHVTGEDASAFLQGQFSNDINHLDPEHCQITAYCNPKGRMLAQFLVIPDSEGYLLLLPNGLVEKTLQRLRMFVLRSKVTLTDVSNEMVCFGLITGQVPTDLSGLPQNDYELSKISDLFVSKIPASPARYLMLGSVEAATRFWDSLATRCEMVSHHAWNWLDIQAGLPNVQSETVEEFVPQMLNLELIGGVDFKKGCYTGQEIVARMHYLGKPKRRMFKLHSDSDDVPSPGNDLYIHGGDGQSAGKVVIAEPSSDNGIDMLAVIRLNHMGSTELRLGAIDGPSLRFETLPYPLESEK